jgi:tRNA A-37 threonylcarbamoyl transferase component Bud32
MKRLLPARLLAALRREATAAYELPDDVVRASRQRVRIAAMLGAVAYALLLALELSGAVQGSALDHRIDLAHDLAGAFLCALLWLASASARLSDRALLAAALVAEVLLCALISTAAPWASFIRTAHVPHHTWVVSVIILFALLVPVRPGRALVVSALCASTMPAGLALLDLAGRIEASPGDYAGASVAGLIGLGIATVASRTVYRAGRQVAAARAVGGYELLEEIGHGGQGEVWKGRHLLLTRAAAVKLILPERLKGSREALDATLARFTHEAQVTSDLRSPHSVQLYDFGTTAENSLYYVMELLDGMNLQHFVYQFGAVEPRRAVHWLRQACHALGEAHACGLIHRDVKPSNLFLCRYGRDVDWIKVLDFGLAKPAARQPDASLTSSGVFLGTPEYMAPEQIYGLPIGPATDFYALGCVAYWLLAGVTTFESEVPGEIMRLHAQAPAPPLSSRAPQPIPPRLEALVLRCLAKEPADRPQDADSLSAALRDSIDGEPWSDAEAGAWWNANLMPVAPAAPGREARRIVGLDTRSDTLS